MLRFFQRFAWRNLSLQAKTAILFLAQILLIAAIAFVALSGQQTVRQELETSVTTAVEMRALSQDLGLNIEQLERFEQRVVEQQFGWESFELSEPGLRSDHAELITQINEDADQLEELGFLFLSSRDMVPISLEIRTIRIAAETSAENFDKVLNLIDQLANNQDGALTELQQYGDQLEDLTIGAGNRELINQMQLVRNLGTSADQRSLNSAINLYLEIYQNNIPQAERIDEIPRTLSSYRQAAAEVNRLNTQLNNTYRASQVSVDLARDAASRLSTLTEAQRQVQLRQITSIQNNARATLIGGLILVFILGSLFTYLFARNITRRTRSVLQTARQFQVGNLDARTEVVGSDEFSQLGRTFNQMAEQLQDLFSGLEQRVAERTRDLTITAEIGQAVTTLQEPRDLMSETVELIRSRFGYYHAQIFIVDDAGQDANLVASTGTAGRELIARRHALAVGSDSVIGQVTARGEPIVALDTGASDVIHKPNPLLPETRSEMALPMRIGDRIIGALDVQSVAPNAFDEDVVAVFQIMADQLAIALDNARLQAEIENTRQDMEVIQRRMAAEVWESYRRVRSPNAPLGFEYRGGAIVEGTNGGEFSLDEAVRTGRLVTVDNEDGESRLAVPIRVRGEVIGAFGFGGGTLQNVTEEDMMLVEAIVDRVGLALENMRLVEETVRRAEHEQVLNEITAKIVGSTDVGDILQTTVRELGRVLRAPQTSVHLRQEQEEEGETNE